MVDLLSTIEIRWFFVPLTMVAAYFKGRRLVLWGFFGYLTGPVALVIVLVLSKLPRKEYVWATALQSRVASKSIEKKFEGLGTTEDFLKEIDNDKKDEK
jgi:hypothetical protein